LSGEGLQHQDGSSHLFAATIPNCVAYDPCFGYELAVIVQDGMRRMLAEQEDVFYYVTVMNEAYAQPAMPAGAEEGIRKGMYLLRAANASMTKRVQLMGSGTLLREALAAAETLEGEGIGADVWSVTSWAELRRDGEWIRKSLAGHPGPVIAVSDYVRAVPDLVRPFIDRPMVTLGTDGFGRSDTRAALREYFGVDRAAIVEAVKKIGTPTPG
jgi:pyruvate dehydrogenase E1 component